MYQTLSHIAYQTIDESYRTMRAMIAPEAGLQSETWCMALDQTRTLQGAVYAIQSNLARASQNSRSAARKAARKQVRI